jgi:hypothetical protein
VVIHWLIRSGIDSRCLGTNSAIDLGQTSDFWEGTFNVKAQGREAGSLAKPPLERRVKSHERTLGEPRIL